MKKLLIIAGLLSLPMLGVQAQAFRGLDKSSLEMAYYPDDFAHTRKTNDEKPLARVLYSRPARNGREVFGKLVPYGKVWRTGANENTEIRLYQDATIGGKKVKAGTYSLFTIPGENEWTIILNNELDYWGAFRHKPESDVIRVTAPVKKGTESLENFSLQFAKASTGGPNDAVMRMGWADTVVEVPVSFQ
ncbi:DUF2911 domain-containing protein [Telluribacter sp.]|jgi:hypothetical protein|uniref:DUF2911 domain-containing protein n=1 Tax=Telluribacter sp. TaxID=1978767 RepID=UPI002E122B42|nr:DUF2911 domain-containing protein [Telluribacter sp.]